MSPRSKDVRLTDAELAVFARGYAHHPGMMALLGHIRVLDADIEQLKAELELAKKPHPGSGHERTYALEDGGI